MLMKDLYLLIKPRFLGFKNQIARNKSKRNKRVFVMGGFGFAFCTVAFILCSRVLLYFQSVETIGDLLAHQLLSMVLLTLFSLLIFSHIIAALSNLYLSKDLELCFSTPVVAEEVFISRATFTLIDSSWMLIIFGIPVFMAYAYVYRPGPGFYIALLHMNLAMVIIAAGIGILVTMILIYIFPAQRTKDIVMLLSLSLIVALYLMFRFLRPERLVNPEAFFTVMQYMSALKVPDSPYLPTSWISETLWDSLQISGRKAHAFNITLTWTTAAAIVVINIWAASAVYFEGFSKSQEAKKRRRGAKRLLDLMIKYLIKPFDDDIAAVMARDIRAFFRDNTQWPQLLLLAALVVVYLYNFSVLPLEKVPLRLDTIQNHIAFLNMGLAGFVLSAVSARFVFPAVSSEGEAYWIIQSSPLTISRYLWGKYLLSLLPMIVLSQILIIVSNLFLDVKPFMMLLSIITMLFMVFGIVALGVGLGAIYPEFKHQNITQVSTGFGGVVYMILSLIFIIVIIVLEAGPMHLLYLTGVRGKILTTPQWCFIVSSLLVAFIVALLAIFTPMKIGMKALREYE